MPPSILIMLKDLRQRARDGTVLVFGLVLPLGMAFLFNLMLGGGEQKLGATYALADADKGKVAGEFVTQVLRPMEESGDIRIRRVGSPRQGARLAERKEVDAVFVFPEGFSEALGEGRSATLTVIGSVDSAAAVQVAREVAEGFAGRRKAIRLAVAVAGGGSSVTAGEERRLAERASKMPDPVALMEDATVTRRQLDTTTFYSAGMAMFFLFFVTLMSITSIFDERRQGTLARLMAAPVSRLSILLGKSLGGVLVGVLSMTILVVVSTFALGARWGDPRGVALLVVAGVLAATGITAAVTTFARTTEQASNRMSVIAMGLGVFGGALFPAAELEGLASVSYVTPHRWFLEGLGDLAGGSLSVVVAPVAVLLGFGLAGTMLAAARLKRMLEP